MAASTIGRLRPLRIWQGNRPRMVPARFAQLRAMVFDLGDVLYDATVWRRWLVRLLSRFGLRVNYAEFFREWDRDYLDDVYRGRRVYAEAFDVFLAAAGLSRAQIDEVTAAAHARRRELAIHRRLLPGVLPTLGRLQAGGLNLALLCEADCPASEVREELQRLGIGHCFGSITSSFDLGNTKPDPVCFQAALAALQLPSEQVAFVGHDARELAAAAALGMATVAFNCEASATADAHCLHFPELLELVQSSRPLPARQPLPGSQLN